MFCLISQFALADCCRDVEMIEKTSLETLQDSGLITEPDFQKEYLDRFGDGLLAEGNYQVYISKQHGGGAGNYYVRDIRVSASGISVLLDFVAGLAEVGAAVMNRRVLIFKLEPECSIYEVIENTP